MIKQFFLMLWLLVFAYSASFSQKYGFFSGAGFVRGEGDFRQFGAIRDSIPLVGSGGSFFYNFGAFLNIPINKSIGTSSSIGIQFFSIPFSTFRDMSARFDSFLVVSKYIMKVASDFRFNSLKLFYSQDLNFRVVDNLNLKSGFSIGYEFQYPKTISYSEDAYIKGVSFVYESKTYETEGRNNFPISVTFDFGLTYLFPHNFFGLFKIGLCPIFSFGFCNITKDFTSDIISVGLNLNFYPEKITPKKKPIEPIKLPTIDSLLPKPIEPIVALTKESTKKEDTLEVDFVGIFSQGTLQKYVPANVLVSSEIYETKVPLLPFIFFDYSKFEIPKRYFSLSNFYDFDYGSLKNKSILEVYYNVLNIVGYRLRNNIGSSITIVGCNSNIGEEQENLHLSRQRANSVASYLSQIWEINPERIKIETGNLPASPSNPRIPEGNSENQRVELRSEEPDILAPIILLDTSLTFYPNSIRIFAKLSHRPDTFQCKIVLSTNKLDTLRKTIVSPLDSFDLDVVSLINLSNNSIPIIDIELNFVQSSNPNKIYRKIISLPIVYSEIRELNLDKEKIVLPPFNFNASKLNSHQIEFLKIFRDKFYKAKKITLVGHTDIIGDKDYNAKLSSDRVNSVAEFLLKEFLLGGKDLPNENAASNSIILFEKEALGETRTPFDNKFPEGRFFSRTVEIIFEY